MMLGLLCGFYACNAHPSWFQQDNCQRHCGAAQIYRRGVWWLQLGLWAEILDLAMIANASSRVKTWSGGIVVYCWSDFWQKGVLYRAGRPAPKNIPSIQFSASQENQEIWNNQNPPGFPPTSQTQHLIPDMEVYPPGVAWPVFFEVYSDPKPCQWALHFYRWHNVDWSKRSQGNTIIL